MFILIFKKNRKVEFMLVQIKKRAQITIPIKVRESLGIKEGDILDIQIKDDEIILKPLKQKKLI